MLGSDGKKMSKSLRNYPDVREVFDRDGADAMRWFLMSSPILRGGNLVVTEQGIRDSVRQVLIPLWNSWYFFSLYANAAEGGEGYDAHRRTDSDATRWTATCWPSARQYVEQMTDQLDNYEVADACDSTRVFLDVLTNWYIRRSRERFWDDGRRRVRHPLHGARGRLPGHRAADAADHRGGLARPHRRALGAPRRLAVRRRRCPPTTRWSPSMDTVRDVCSAGSALRKAANLRNRLPLARADRRRRRRPRWPASSRSSPTS